MDSHPSDTICHDTTRHDNLIKHCENGDTSLKDIDQDLTTVGMKEKLQ
jgi:hypothetical protein